MQVKYQLDFPGAPSGAIEAITVHALQEAYNSGVQTVTFGAGASEHLTIGHGISGLRVKILTHAYDHIRHALKIGEKAGFRDKFTSDKSDMLYVCYPKLGLGVAGEGVQAVLDFFEADG